MASQGRDGLSPFTGEITEANRETAGLLAAGAAQVSGVRWWYSMQAEPLCLVSPGHCHGCQNLAAVILVHPVPARCE